MREAKTIKISRDELHAVLKEWDKYTQLQLSGMPPKGFYGRFDSPGHENARHHVEEKSLSGLADLLWRSLRLGAAKVDEIHETEFVETQVGHFRESFVEKAHLNLDYDYYRYDGYSILQDPENPMHTFALLGKPAQLQIVREGLLDIAMSNYQKLRESVKENNYRTNTKLEEERRERNVFQATMREVRKLDGSKCVFCGREYRYGSFSYWSDNDEEFTAATVWLSCNGCEKKMKAQRIEPKFGRFLVT